MEKDLVLNNNLNYCCHILLLTLSNFLMPTETEDTKEAKENSCYHIPSTRFTLNNKVQSAARLPTPHRGWDIGIYLISEV